MLGIQRIVAERKRQIEDEGWDAAHDAEHTKSEIVHAAICYAAMSALPYKDVFHENRAHGINIYRDPWPWDNEWDKRHQHRFGDNEIYPDVTALLEHQRIGGRIRCLEIAGALIAAEIDRIQAEVE